MVDDNTWCRDCCMLLALVDNTCQSCCWAKASLQTCVCCSPLHFCKHCGEDHSTAQNELIPCRRCPKAYHEHCMPQQLCTPLDEKKSRSFKQRIWRAQFDDDGEDSALPCISDSNGCHASDMDCDTVGASAGANATDGQTTLT